MLSTEIPPSDPSCSSSSRKISGLKDRDEAPHESHFSIRDYVSSARSNDIEANWPFPTKLLHLCLKHGVKDILPPFEPPDLVRASQCQKKVVGNQLIIDVDSEKVSPKANEFGAEDLKLNETKHDACGPDDQINIISSDQAQCPLPEKGNLTPDREDAKPHRLSQSLDSSETGGEGDTASEDLIELEDVNPPHSSKKAEISREPSDKKRRLIVRLGPISASGRTEEIVSNSSVISEPMASKVCPVCKTFSSPSNTTLNAHIDQCLSMDSTIKGAMNELTKQRVKPRKKRLLEDIYATARHCTLEEIDQRNGSNWATNLSSLAPNSNSHDKSKRSRKHHVDFVDDSDENAVYFDSKGTKLRILSKLGGSTSTPGEICTPMKEDDKNGENFSSSKKRLATKLSKFLKVKLPCKKSGEFSRTPDGTITHEDKGELLSQLLKARAPVKGGKSGTSRKWVCAKRTDLPRKLNCRDPVPTKKKPSIESNQSDLSKPSGKRSLVLKLSRLPENSTASLRNKREKIFFSREGLTDSGNKSSKLPDRSFIQLTQGASSKAGVCASKLPTSVGNCVSSPRSKRVEINTPAAQMAPKLSVSHHLFLQKAQKASTLWSSLFGKRSVRTEANKCSKNEKQLTAKKPIGDICIEKLKKRKLPFVGGERCDRMGDSMNAVGPGSADPIKKKRKFPSAEVERFGRAGNSINAFGPSSLGPKKIYRTHKLDRSKNVKRPITEEMSLERTKLLKAGMVTKELNVSKLLETGSSEMFQMEGEYHGPDTVNICVQVGGSSHQNLGSNICPVKSDDQQFVTYEATSNGDTDVTDSTREAARNDTQNSEGNLPTIHANIQSNSSTIHANIQSNSSPPLEEEHAGSTFASCADKEIHFSDYNPIDGSEAAKDWELKENSLTAPNRPQSYEHQDKPVNRDPSSPVSAVSTLSSKSTETFDAECPEKESLAVSTTICGDLNPSYQNNFAESSLPGVNVLEPGVGAERTKLDMEKPKIPISPAAERIGLLADQSCSCTLKESVSCGPMNNQEPQLLMRKGITATAIVLSDKENQMASNQTCESLEFCTSVLSPTSGVNKMVMSTKASLETALENLNCSDSSVYNPLCHTNAQSASHPILRLMGKDLMVVNNEKDESLQPLAVPSNHPSPNYPSPSYNILSQEGCSCYHRSYANSMILSLDSSSLPQAFDVNFSTSLHQTPLEFPGANHVIHGGSFASSEFEIQLERLKGETSSPFSFNVRGMSSQLQCEMPDSSAANAANPMRDVVVIDDSSGIESDQITTEVNYTVG